MRTQSSLVVILCIRVGSLEEVTAVKEVVRGKARRINFHTSRAE